MLSSTDKECENLENIKQETLSLKEEIKSIGIKMRANKETEQAWQTKINNFTRQHQRNLGQLQKLNSGLQQSKKDKSEHIAKWKSQKKSTEKVLKQHQGTNDSLDMDFNALEKRYKAVLNKYVEELVKRF